jgi:hypothetical protein
MENFINETEKEIEELINMEDDENEECYRYEKEGWEWYINKLILKSNEKENLIELRVKRDNSNGINKNEKGERIIQSCWVYIENKNCIISTGKDAAVVKKDGKIQNGLSYVSYRMSIY